MTVTPTPKAASTNVIGPRSGSLLGGYDPEVIRDALIERQRRLTSVVYVAVRLGGRPWMFYRHDRIDKPAPAAGKRAARLDDEAAA